MIRGCLMDTNVVSELARPRPSRALLGWFTDQQTVILSVVTVEELSYGVARLPAGRRGKLTHWLDALLASASMLLEVTGAVAKSAGELRAAREIAGRKMAQADALIGATAIVHGLTLATRNVRDFAGCGISLIDPFEG